MIPKHNSKIGGIVCYLILIAIGNCSVVVFTFAFNEYKQASTVGIVAGDLFKEQQHTCKFTTSEANQKGPLASTSNRTSNFSALSIAIVFVMNSILKIGNTHLAAK